MRRGGEVLAVALLVAFGPPASRAVAEEAGADDEPGGGAVAAEDEAEELPAAAASRRLLAEPTGDLPAPWAALSATVEGAARVDGEAGWTGLRVHVPVASRYGAVDARLRVRLDDEGFVGIEPELWLRALPLRLVDGGRAALGVALGAAPAMVGSDPILTLTGGVVGGYLGRSWFARAVVAVRGEVLERRAPVEILGTAAAGLRLAHGLRPQLEVDLAGPAAEGGELALGLRPALRYWPADWIGIGVAGEIWALGPDAPWYMVRADLVFHALE